MFICLFWFGWIKGLGVPFSVMLDKDTDSRFLPLGFVRFSLLSLVFFFLRLGITVSRNPLHPSLLLPILRFHLL